MKKRHTDHGGILSPLMACYHAAHDYPGGLPVLASLLNKPLGTLQKKLNPNVDSHLLTLEEAAHILRITKDARILDALGGKLDPLLDALKDGTLRGVAGMVSCTTLRDTGQDSHTVDVVKELIKRDVLVLSMGCGNGAVQVAGLCSPEAKEFAGPGLKAICEALGIPPVLSYGTCTDTGRLADLLAAVSEGLGGVPLPDLPVVATAPEYMEQKATIDAVFALALGLHTHVNPVPTVTGAPDLVKLLTQACKDVTGGLLNVETDAVKAVDSMMEHIESKRAKLGI